MLKKLSAFVMLLGISSFTTAQAVEGLAALLNPPTLLKVIPYKSKNLQLEWVNENSKAAVFFVERSLNETSEFVEIGKRNAREEAKGIEFYRDRKIQAGVTYFYRVRTYDRRSKEYSGYSQVLQGRNDAVKPTPVPSPTASPTPVPTPTTSPTPNSCSDISAIRRVVVSTSGELQAALKSAIAGDLIELKDGIYPGRFVVENASGTSANAIGICGSAKAILDGGDHSAGYGLYFNGVSYWNVIGITVQNSQKGIMLDGSSFCVLNRVEVKNIGMEAVHFRKSSAYNILKNSNIHNTGETKPDYGEGVYIGSAKSNLKDDKSDHNQILNNQIGPDVGAELIDIKEYSTGGVIQGNHFDGHGMSGKNFSDSWIDVKGNGYLIKDNFGVSSILDGYQTHEVVDGWGTDNVFDANISDVQGPGYAIRITGSGANTVKCSNQVTNAALGLSNVTCTP